MCIATLLGLQFGQLKTTILPFDLSDVLSMEIGLRKERVVKEIRKRRKDEEKLNSVK